MSCNIKYQEFQNICRTCLFNTNLKPIQDNVMLTVLQHLTDINFVNDDKELPQQICETCIKKIHDIHTFALQCKSSDLILNETLINYKKDSTNNISVNNVKEIITEDESFKPEIDKLIEQNKFFIKTENFDYETNIDFNEKETNQKKKPTIFKCETCEKTFNRADHLVAHKRVHTGERPYKCQTCSATFIYSGHLTRHHRIHTGERPYKCDTCDKTFSYSGSLMLHKTIHTNERSYKCETCSKTFNRHSDLKQHKRIHTGERPYKCDICPKSFHQAGNLIAHKRLHTGERPYKCQTCEKAFNRLYDLQTHKRLHTGERPYKCQICEKTFNHSSCLVKHVKRNYCKWQQ